jgi:hypothetical protein
MSIQSASEEIDETIKAFLNLLAGFQKRAKEANPLKAKQKQRFLAGIKQVLPPRLLRECMLLIHSPWCDGIRQRTQ